MAASTPRAVLFAEQVGEPQPQLAGGAHAERDGEDLARRRRAGGQQVRDAVRERAGLAGAGAGDDQQRAGAVADGLRPARASGRRAAARGRGAGARGSAPPAVGWVMASPPGDGEGWVAAWVAPGCSRTRSRRRARSTAWGRRSDPGAAIWVPRAPRAVRVPPFVAADDRLVRQRGATRRRNADRHRARALEAANRRPRRCVVLVDGGPSGPGAARVAGAAVDARRRRSGRRRRRPCA